MQFKNSTHKRRFMSAIKPMDQKDKTQMAVAFLLTATKALWDRSRICMINNKILVHRIHLNHILTIIKYYKINKVAAWLQLPYLLWVTFAGYLNVAIILLN